ncbi:MAG: WG repeat-containing protein, partial [bacterium]|nr:WG repeat-containing protein [bacterium]
MRSRLFSLSKHPRAWAAVAVVAGLLVLLCLRPGTRNAKPSAGSRFVHNRCQTVCSDGEVPAYPPLFAIRTKGKRGFIDIMGDIVIRPQFARVEDVFYGRLAYASSGGLYGYINREGEWAIQPEFYVVQPFSEGRAPVMIDGKWGYIDETGDVVIPPRYDSVRPFCEG